jgi:hypothetical protein
MPIQFTTKEALVDELLAYYRQEAYRLSGPTEAVTEQWDHLRRVTARNVLLLLARERIAYLVSHQATHGQPLAQPEDVCAGTLMVTTHNSLDPTSPTQIYHVPVEQTAATTVHIVVPTILRETVYVTETIAKPLLYFTLEDFTYCLERHGQQRDGLTRRIAAMETGAGLLRVHRVAQVNALPQEALDLFATRWREAVKGTESAAAD